VRSAGTVWHGAPVLKFGTDGVRGVALTELTPELVTALGRAAARTFTPQACVVARDTRQSGPALEGALTAGLVAEGVDVVTLGVAPTPAAAWVSAADGVLGAVISASHNPYQDNGVKLFAPGGRKLSDAEEDALEAELGRLLGAPPPAPESAPTGSARDGRDAVERWTRSVIASTGGRRLDGLHVVVDCANGAASAVGPTILRSLGAQVDVLHAAPDGTNINEGCGSTHPGALQEAVVARGAAAGIAFDGDADRALAVDAAGRLIDGDQIIGIGAIDRKERGALPGGAVVVTVMANLGFRRGMAAHGIEVVEVPVGDRHVLAALDERGLALGGEQSGHVIHRDLATTGDGVLTAVQLLDVVVHTGRALADLADDAMTRLPQVLRSVRVDRRGAEVAAELEEDVAAASAELGEDGRVLLRPSGTEPVVRVMVEATTLDRAEIVADRLVAAVTGKGSGATR
jgi:phosphoglucosamine mutase